MAQAAWSAKGTTIARGKGRVAMVPVKGGVLYERDMAQEPCSEMRPLAPLHHQTVNKYVMGTFK